MRECPECGSAYGDEASRCTRDGATLVPEGQDPRIGKQVGNYLVTRCLGRGGMGAVYQAEHPAIGSKVALKFLHKRYAADPGIVERFFNEARAVNLIGHENVVRVTDFATADDGSPYFVMEYLEGKPLSSWVGTPRPLAELGPVMLQVADGLQAAHDRGIVHRDLKPDNIFLVTQARRTNVAKIVDFGIAKLLQPPAGVERTHTGVVMGTAHYMSPEQAAGEVSRIGPASDVYSLGVILFQLSTGRLPFEGASFGEILVGHMMKEPPRPRDVAASVSPSLEPVILRCLAKEPSARYESMAALYDALAAALDAEGLPHEPPTLRSNPPAARAKSAPPAPSAVPTEPADHQPARRPARLRARLPARAIAAGAMAFAVVVAVAWWLARPAPAPPPESVKSTSPTAKLTLVTEPAGARVTVTANGAARDYTTPVTIDRPAAAAVATFRAEGFRSVERALDENSAVEVRVVLEPLAPAPEPAPAQPAPQEPAPARPAAKKRTPRAVGDGLMEVDL